MSDPTIRLTAVCAHILQPLAHSGTPLGRFPGTPAIECQKGTLLVMGPWPTNKLIFFPPHDSTTPILPTNCSHGMELSHLPFTLTIRR
jgi:hypothetical protein